MLLTGPEREGKGQPTGGEEIDGGPGAARSIEDKYTQTTQTVALS